MVLHGSRRSLPSDESQMAPSREEKRPRLSSAGSSASLATKEDQLVEKLLVNRLGIKPSDISRVNDDRVQALVKQMAGIIVSQESFHELSKVLPPEIRNAKFEKIDGIDFDAGDETIGTFAEKQWLMMEEFAGDFVAAFNEVSSIYKLNTVKNVNVVLSSLTDDQPLPASELASLFGIDELNNAAKVLAGSNPQWIAGSRAFYLNVQRMMCRGTRSEHEVDLLRLMEDKLERARADLITATDEITLAKGKLVAARHMKDGLAELRRGKENYIKWLTEELATTDQALQSAKKRVHDYTFRMWGPFVDMWKRDVELAKEDVKRYTQEKKDLEKKKEEAKTNAVLDTDTMVSKNAEEMSKLEHELSEKLEKQKQRAERDIEEHEKSIHEVKQKLDSTLREAGAASLRHLRQIEETADCWAANNKVAAMSRHVLKGPIQRQISTVACLLNQMQSRSTASGQRNILRALVTLLTQKDDQAAVFFRKSQIMEALGSPNPIHWGLADMENVEEAPQLNHVRLDGMPAPSLEPPSQTPHPALPPPPTQASVDIPESDDEPTL